MNKYIRILTLVSLISPVTSSGESMIGNFLKKLQKPSKDLSLNNPGIKKVGSGLYIYKLNNNLSSMSIESDEPRGSLPYNHEAIAAHKREMADKEINKAVSDEKQMLYGSEKSPIRNASVVAAWDKANEAERRLQEHREYMNQVRHSRKNISSKKSLTK
jgi:hypothetical protein